MESPNEPCVSAGTFNLDEMVKAGIIQDYKIITDNNGRIKSFLIVPFAYVENIEVKIGFTK